MNELCCITGGVGVEGGGRFRGNVKLEWELRACDCIYLLRTAEDSHRMELGYMERNGELHIFS
jgi:hypothetical protein